ncbi:MAG TPA: hypothetical protein VKV04_11700 [Verrucomicrobiae bacterium]|nr:hypothetical protein [Verrucomicrobiae bacterium]
MKHILIICIASIAITIAGGIYLRPAFTSVASAQASLLAQTPIGSNMEEVRNLAQKQGWIKPGAQIFTNTLSGFPFSLQGILWHDPYPYDTWVEVGWRFDRSNRLDNVLVFRNRYL